MNEKGIIVYTGAFELPDRNAAAHRVVSNARIFRDLGYDVVLLGVRKDDDEQDEFISRDQDHFEFECWSIPYPRNAFDWAKYVVGKDSISKFITQNRSSNVVATIFYNYPAIAQLRYAALIRRLGISYLADATEWYSAAGGRFFFRIVKWVDTALRMRFAHFRADGLLTTSNYLTSHYEQRNKVALELPTLYDANAFPPPAVRENRQGRRFIYVGSPFDPERVNQRRSNLKERLDRSIVCFSKLCDEGVQFRFSIFGLTRQDYLQVFPEHVRDLAKMGDSVQFFGRQSNEIVIRAVALSDVSVFFRDETRVTLAGFPSKFAESISCGTPVISNRMPSIEPFIDLDFVFLAESDEEYDVIRSVALMPDKQVQELKCQAYKSRLFDYRNYSSKVQVFFDHIGI